VRSKVLPAEYGRVTFDQFEAAFLDRRNERRWIALLNTLKAATPPDRWAPNLDANLRWLIINYVWAAAVTPRPTASAPVRREARQAAQRAQAALDEAEAAYHALADSYDTELPRGLGASVAERRLTIAFILATPASRGGRPTTRQFEYLMALCGSLFRTLTGQKPSGSMRAPFARFAHQVTGLVESAQAAAGLKLLTVPLGTEAFPKRLMRLTKGQNHLRS
jgi:hypothetical protein